MRRILARPWFKVLLIVVVLLLCLRIALPTIIKHYINKAIADAPGYSGHVEDVDLGIIRAWMRVNGIVIYKDSLSKTEPIFACAIARVQFSWLHLFKRELVGNLWAFEPQLRIVAESPPEAKQEAKATAKDAEESTDKVIRALPVRIDKLEIEEGRVRFLRTDTKPPIDLRMSGIHLVVENLTNSKRLSGTRLAKATMTGKTTGDGDFSLAMSIDPLSKLPDFDMKSKLLHLQAKSLNPITKEYGKFDFEKGSIDLVVEAESKGGRVKGYVKPLLKDIEISSPEDKKRDNDGFFKRAWEAIVGASEEVLENQPKDQSGTRIPFEGPLENPKTNLFRVASEVLRNAFVRALFPNYDAGSRTQKNEPRALAGRRAQPPPLQGALEGQGFPPGNDHFH